MEMLTEQIGFLTRLLQATEMRQKIIGQNIANVNTPGYHRMEVDFEAALARELQHPESANSGGQANPEVRLTSGLPYRADGNNVDIDMEVGQMNKNALLQQVYLQVIGAEMNMMRRAIDGG